MDLDLMRNAELQEAFNEFDKAGLSFHFNVKRENSGLVSSVEIVDSGSGLTLSLALQ